MSRYPERDKLPLESAVNLFRTFFFFFFYLETMTNEKRKVFACRLNLKRDLFALESLWLSTRFNWRFHS